jgi:hypothetical protein
MSPQKSNAKPNSVNGEIYKSSACSSSKVKRHRQKIRIDIEDFNNMIDVIERMC